MTMRLLVFSGEFPPGPGGIGTHAFQLAQNLQAFGWQVLVLTLQDFAEMPEVERFNTSQTFEIRHLDRKNGILSNLLYRSKKLLQVIKDWHPDLVVVTGDRLVWLVSFLQIKVPWVAIWHGVVPNNFFYKRISARAFSCPDLTISVSQYSLKQMLEMGANPVRHCVITNGADSARYVPNRALNFTFRSAWNIPMDAQVLLTVGHMSERKGQDLVIQALPEILKTHPHVHYVIVGIPTLQKELEKLVERLGVSQHVHFLGRLSSSEIVSAYNACDIFVLLSRHSSDGSFEGYGIVAVEAALCGKPSIVAGNSGLAEAVLDGLTGLVVPENDPVAAAAAVKKLFNDSALLEQMGQAARNRAVESQTWDASMRQYDVSFRDLLRSC